MSRLVAIGEVMIGLSGGIDDRWCSGVAGDTFNTLWYARLGLDPGRDSVEYFTALGTDSQSDRILGTLSHAKIGTSHIRRIEGRLPGLYMIEQRDGDRAFLYWRGQSAARALADYPAALSQALQGADMVYLSGITLAILAPQARQRLLDALDGARKGGAIIAFDPNIRPALWDGAEDMRRVQDFVQARGVRDNGPMAGAPYDALDAAGGVTEATHLLWPLTEAGKLYAQVSLDEGNAAAADRAFRIAGTIFGRYFAPMDTPRWVNRLDGDGRVVWDEALSRLLYHVALLVTEGGRAGLWRLDGSDALPRHEQDGIPLHITKEERL